MFRLSQINSILKYIDSLRLKDYLRTNILYTIIFAKMHEIMKYNVDNFKYVNNELKY